MSQTKNYLFKVLNTSRSVRSRYENNLGWFFDDAYNNPLSFPLGVTAISADDKTNELNVTFIPADISLEQIKNYLTEIGIETLPLHEYKTSLRVRFIEIVLYPFIFIIGSITLLCLYFYKIYKRKNNE